MSNTYYAYTRVSTVKQGDGVSLEAQKEAVERYASEHRLTITRWFEEKETAAKQGRPVFTEMVSLLTSGAAQGVIMHKIDRSARNLRDWATVGDLQDAGCDVHFAAESVDFASRGGRLTADIQAVIAADYIRNLREECIKGLNGRLKQGLYPFGAPTGYLNNGGGKPKTICPTKGPLVAKLFKLYANGEHSLNSLTLEANRLGLTGPKGGMVGKTMVENMLANPFYIGLIHMKRSGKTYQGIHEPLISVKTFEQVAAVRAGRYVKKRPRNDYPFRRIFKCGFCGKSFIAEKQKGHIYYRCHTSQCPSPTLREDGIALQVEQFMRGITLPKDYASAILDSVKSWTPKDGETSTFDDLERKKASIGKKKDKLIDAMLEGLIDRATFDKKHHELLVQESEAVEKQKKPSNSPNIRATLPEIVELLKKPYYTYQIANIAEKRRMLELLSSNRVITTSKLAISTRNWLEELQISLAVQFGAPVTAINRSRPDVAFQETKYIYDLLSCPEITELLELTQKIHSRKTHSEIEECETVIVLERAA